MEISKTFTDTLLGNSSINTLSKVSGANSDQVRQVLTNALPTLVRSMQKNASTEQGAAGLTKALSDHAKSDASDIGSFLQQVDLDDGTKILGHILGGKKNTVETGIAKKTGLTSSQISTILAVAAPLLLNLLGNKKKEEDEKESGGLLSVLTSVLLGGGENKDDDNDGLGEVLAGGIGSLLGGSGSSNSGGLDLGNMIGSFLGGGKQPKKQSVKKATVKKAATTKKKAGKPAVQNKKKK